MERLRPEEYTVPVPVSRGGSTGERLAIPLGFMPQYDSMDARKAAIDEAEKYDFSISEPSIDEKIDYISDSTSHYFQDQVRDTKTVLRSHQRSVFGDLVQFTEDTKTGERSGFVRLPTGTGKTVIFVELCRAMLSGDDPDQQPRILVVTPTKDLVRQTQGTDMEKGFAKFAPEIPTSNFYSDTRTTVTSRLSDQLRQSQVCITTYDSFGTLFDRNEESPFCLEYEYEYQIRPTEYRRSKAYYYPPTGRQLIDLFDVVIFDEAHNTLGEASKQNVERAKRQGKICIGFSATTHYSSKKDLKDLLPAEIHTMDIGEAIELDLLSPIVAVGVESESHVDERDGIINFTGDYRANKLEFLGRDPKRNQLIVDSARELTEAGLGVVISCLAGEEREHPNLIADLINKQVIVDFATGGKRRMRAASVDSKVPAHVRSQLYKDFETGKLDVLTYINVLTEGWDSQRAKGLINARPTRSKVFAQQRLGRILRLTDEHAPLAVVIDVLDEFKHFPPVTSADVICGNTVPAGEVIGRVADYEPSFVDEFKSGIIQRLGRHCLLEDKLLPLYTERKAFLENYDILPASGIYEDKEMIDLGPRGNKYMELSAMDSNDVIPFITPEVVKSLEVRFGVELETRTIRDHDILKTIYNISDVQELVNRLPEIEPEQYHIDPNGDKWLSPVGFKGLLHKVLPSTSAEQIRVILEKMEVDGNLDHAPMFARYHHGNTKSGKQYGFIKLYKYDLYKEIARSIKSS